MNKSILILNWRCPYNSRAGGAEMITQTHARAWVESGYDVVWFAERTGDLPSVQIENGITYYRIGVEHKIDSFLAPFTYGLFLIHVIWIYWVRFKGKFDLVIDEVHGPIYWITFWAWRSKKLIYVHEVAQNIWDKMLPWPLNVIGKTVERLMYAVYKNVPFMTASQSTRDDLVAFGVPEDHIHIIPHGIDISAADTIQSKGTKLNLIFVARLVKMKGVEDAIEIVERITKKIPEVRLFILGSGTPDYVKHLQNQVRELHVGDNVEFMGYVDRKKQILLYQKAHFLVHTSVREGFGLVVLEANSQGTPAIVYNSPGLRDIVVNGVNGYVLPFGDIDSIAEKIIQVYNNSALYARLQTSSRDQSLLYKWDTITRLSSEYIASCIAK